MAPATKVNFAGERLEDAVFSGAHLHAPDLGGVKITDGWLVDADISGDIEGLRLNGIEVAPLVEAELDRRFPERVALRSDDQSGLATAWEIVQELWRPTVDRAHALASPLVFERVDDEWSFVETLRHLVFATDAWLGRMVRGELRPYHPWGLAGSFLTDPASLGLEITATPSLDEMLGVRGNRMEAVRATIDGLSGDELARVCVPPDETGHPRAPHTVLECLHVILNEEWWHCRYANRDLELLEARIP